MSFQVAGEDAAKIVEELVRKANSATRYQRQAEDWQADYEQVRDAALEHLDDYVFEDDVPEPCIIASAVENAGIAIRQAREAIREMARRTAMQARLGCDPNAVVNGKPYWGHFLTASGEQFFWREIQQWDDHQWESERKEKGQ